MQVIFLPLLLALNVFALPQATPSSASPAETITTPSHISSSLSNTAYRKRKPDMTPPPVPHVRASDHSNCSPKYDYSEDIASSCTKFYDGPRYFQFEWQDVKPVCIAQVWFYNDTQCQNVFYKVDYKTETCFDTNTPGPKVGAMSFYQADYPNCKVPSV